MLILMDGRTLYNPLFGGTYWDIQDTIIEDIDRIEVIRGPGGSSWGANAVTGIVNIVSRPARLTPGAMLAAGGGSGRNPQRSGGPLERQGGRPYLAARLWQAP